MLGDPTEGALLTAGGTLCLQRTHLETELPRVAELPFDSARRRMTTAHALSAGRRRVICKGAPEAVLRKPLLADRADADAAA